MSNGKKSMGLNAWDVQYCGGGGGGGNGLFGVIQYSWWRNKNVLNRNFLTNLHVVC